ncbi:mpv17-like protein 2 [Sander vitreus]
MLPRMGKQFLVWIRFDWRPLFQGRALLFTNTLSGGVLLALADILEQSRQNFRMSHRVQDWRRTGNMFTVGCSMGPVMHCWYIWLDKVLVGKALKTVGKKVLADQLISTPFLGMWYFSGMAVMEERTLTEGLKEFKDKFWEMYRADWCFWPPAQMINFYFISPKFRIIFMNFVDLVWSTYISNLKYRDDSHPTEQESDSSAVDVQQEALPPSKPLEAKA